MTVLRKVRLIWCPDTSPHAPDASPHTTDTSPCTPDTSPHAPDASPHTTDTSPRAPDASPHTPAPQLGPGFFLPLIHLPLLSCSRNNSFWSVAGGRSAGKGTSQLSGVVSVLVREGPLGPLCPESVLCVLLLCVPCHSIDRWCGGSPGSGILLSHGWTCVPGTGRLGWLLEETWALEGV